MTGTGTSSFSTAKIDAYIRKKTLELGARKYLWRKFVNKERIEPGMSATWKAVRYLRLDVPLVALTEGVAPTETDLAVEVITCTAVQYGITVKITDILQLTIASQPLQKAVEKKADVMSALDDKLISEVAMSGINVLYGGTTATTRSGLSATGGDVVSSTHYRKAVASLRATDGVKGRAPTVQGGPEGGLYVGLLHEKQLFDIQADTDWKNMAYRLDREDLEQGKVNEWAGAAWYSSDFLPVLTNPWGGNAGGAALDIASGAGAVTGTRGMNGFLYVASAGGALTASKFFAVVITRRHRKRGMEEDISSTFSVATAAAQGTITMTMPADTNYFYTVYFSANQASGAAARGLTRSSIFRVALNQAAGASVVVTAEPAAGVNPPVNPPQDLAATGNTDPRTIVFTSFVLGGDALAVVDLQDMESYLVKGPDAANPLNQFVIVGSKFMVGGCILQDAFLQRIEAQSAFGT